MRILAALLVALPLAAAAQPAPPAEAPIASPAAAEPTPVAAPAPAPQPAPAAQTGPRHEPWYIGFGLGTAIGEGTGAFFNFKVGTTLTQDLLLGLDVNGIRAAGSGSNCAVAMQLTTYNAMLTWFPAERGFLLRGGLGLSRVRVDWNDLDSAGLSGLNLDVGAGYAFWLGRTFNLTLNLDFAAQFDGSGAGSSFTALWLGFDWY